MGNIFDVTICLPIPWLLNALLTSPRGQDLDVLPIGWLLVLFLMLMVLLTIVTICVNGWAMTKTMGCMMILLFVCFDVGSVLAITYVEGTGDVFSRHRLLSVCPILL